MTSVLQMLFISSKHMSNTEHRWCPPQLFVSGILTPAPFLPFFRVRSTSVLSFHAQELLLNHRFAEQKGLFPLVLARFFVIGSFLRTVIGCFEMSCDNRDLLPCFTRDGRCVILVLCRQQHQMVTTC